MHIYLKYLLYFVFFITLIGCGTTKVITDKGIDADIYLNGVKKGKKEIEIKKTGIPKKIKLTAKYKGVTIGSIEEKRKFKFSTCLIGYLTYGIGLFTAWRFPDVIIIPVKGPLFEDDENPWVDPSNSEWMIPINKNH